MSTIWTPSGERPIRREPEPQPDTTTQAPPSSAPGGPGGEEMTEEEILAQMAAVERHLAEAPAAVVVANHCMGLFQLAAIHLNQQPPKMDDARLAIDAMAAIVDSLGDRLGPDAKTLKEAVGQLQMAFIQVKQQTGT